jgi:hypothetical protein
MSKIYKDINNDDPALNGSLIELQMQIGTIPFHKGNVVPSARICRKKFKKITIKKPDSS